MPIFQSTIWLHTCLQTSLKHKNDKKNLFKQSKHCANIQKMRKWSIEALIPYAESHHANLEDTSL